MECFDTTSSNKGQLSGAFTILELVLAAAFGVCMGKSPESIVDAFSDDMVSAKPSNVKDEIIVFYEQQLLDQQPRDNYRVLLKLGHIFLGRKLSNWKNF